ncbi:hypothetical protein B0H66DRAFT_539315 [Apodospora peruviana]|uniref:Uncharacterized protein n=1 Tax=Apodospora peruviana TaxID=516989 RepID=A0AAE0IP43_9PEZI|nr:hypothetical protein B0H66DRAFT_539315 [Apodospora peruviana]
MSSSPTTTRATPNISNPSAALRGFGRKVLSFCYRVRRARFKFNIFFSPRFIASNSNNNMQLETFAQKMSVLLERIAHSANFTFDDLDSSRPNLSVTLESWLINPNAHNLGQPNGSLVALCCSHLLAIQFQEELLTTNPDDDSPVAEDFQRFLLLAMKSLAWRSSSREMKQPQHASSAAVGHLSGGYRLIKRLDGILTTQFLSQQCSPEYCQVLFLLVLGTVLGVGYSVQQTTSEELTQQTAVVGPSITNSGNGVVLDNSEFRHSPTLWLATKEHLSQMLAHHLISLGSHLGISDASIERRIIDAALDRWSKMESFIWAPDWTPTTLIPSMTTENLGGLRIGGAKEEEEDDILLRVQDNDENPPYWEDGDEDMETSALLVAAPMPPTTTTEEPHVPPPPPPPEPCAEPGTYYFPEEEPDDYHDNNDEEESQFLRAAGGDNASIKGKRAMTDPGPPSSRQQQQQQQQQQEHFPEIPPWRTVKRRTMWVVRPAFDAGAEGNVQRARVRRKDIVFI